ncbi:substrate-binding domain-containing protein [Solirhodobacter olei]|uniref:substrate-binding domain-containing protein n=1 Tax=Solirhodobacter olei TaxID=2493082 RepID=UPI000FDCD2E2
MHQAGRRHLPRDRHRAALRGYGDLRSPRPTAGSAIGNGRVETFSAIRALGKSIPDDVSLISYFDADWTRVTAPEVTVVDQPIYELGKSAADLVLARISGGVDEHRRLVVPTRLIERGSIGEIHKRL